MEQTMQVLASATIGDKIVEVLSLNGVATENETTYSVLLPTIHSWVFVVSFRQFEQAQLCMGFGKGEALCPLRKQ